MAEPHPTDKLVATLTRLYSDAYQRTLERLAAGIRSGKSTVYYRGLLRDLGELLQRLRLETYTWTRETLPKAWEMGAQATIRELVRSGVRADASLAVVNEAAVRVTAQNLLLNLDEALVTTQRQALGWAGVGQSLAPFGARDVLPPIIGRRVQDQLRALGLEATARKLTEGLTVRDVRKILEADLQQAGLTAVVDQAGRRWNLRAYAEMVARTTSREAYTQGTLQTVQRAGHDLVRASTHWPTCPICAARQGRVYSITGRTPGWPALSEVGPPPWHPACGHSLAPFIPELRDPEEVERLQRESNRPFDEDPRSKAERDAYERAQRINALRRERRRILMELGSDAVPMDAVMRRWAAEMAEAPAARRRELQEKLAERMERWEAERKARLKEIDAELRELNRQQREAIQNMHRLLTRRR